MTQRASALSCLPAAAAMCMASSAKAGIWYTDPVLGVAGDYSSNPGLLYTHHTGETHGAVLIDTPTTYHADAVSFSLQPSFRISDSTGYSSLASDYERLTASGEIDTERNTLSARGQVSRDSSLYYDYGFNGSTGVRRDTALAGVTWIRALTERMNFNLDVSSSRVIYGVSNSFATLTDY